MKNKSVNIILLLLLSACLGGGAAYWLYAAKNMQPAIVAAANDTVNTAEQKTYKMFRLNGYKFVRPLLYADMENEAAKFSGLKADLTRYITDKRQGGLIDASVYLRDFSHGEWMLIGPGTSFDQGSLLNIFVLIAYLKTAEHDAGLLSRELAYGGGVISGTLTEGQSYKVSDLLHYMIAGNDKGAVACLVKNMDTRIYNNTFTDLGFPRPVVEGGEYKLSAKDYSRLIVALYNATYVSIPLSEEGEKLLAGNTYRDGMTKLLPETMEVAHNYGASSIKDTEEEHEAGVVYYDHMPYLLTIMTKGKDKKILSDAISNISKMVYDKMTSFAH